MVCFILMLARTGKVAAAARSVGMSRESAYRRRARPDGAPFARAWDRALDDARARRAAGSQFARTPEGRDRLKRLKQREKMGRTDTRNNVNRVRQEADGKALSRNPVRRPSVVSR